MATSLFRLARLRKSALTSASWFGHNTLLFSFIVDFLKVTIEDSIGDLVGAIAMAVLGLFLLVSCCGGGYEAKKLGGCRNCLKATMQRASVSDCV